MQRGYQGRAERISTDYSFPIELWPNCKFGKSDLDSLKVTRDLISIKVTVDLGKM